MTLLWKQLTLIFRAISEIRGKSKRPDEARIYNFVKDFFDDSGLSDGFFWERTKSLEDQGVIINRPTKYGSYFFLSQSLHGPTENNSNTINTTPTVSLPSNIQMCLNYHKDISLQSEGIDSLEQLFYTQPQNLKQMSPVKSNSNGINTNNVSDILIESLHLIKSHHVKNNELKFAKNITTN